MCTVSMIGDHYRDWLPNQYPNLIPSLPSQIPPSSYVFTPPITREEFDALKRDVEQMKALLKRAKEYDERNNEPNCEVEDKMDLLRKIAKLVGVDLDDVLAPQARGEL